MTHESGGNVVCNLAGSVLLVDDENIVISTLKAHIESAFPNVKVFTANSFEEGKQRLIEREYSLGIIDYSLSRDHTGLDLLDFNIHDTPLVLLTGFEKVVEKVKKEGLPIDVWIKPMEHGLLVHQLEKALQFQSMFNSMRVIQTSLSNIPSG